MAEDVEMTPISPAEGGSVPPKVAPFGAAATPAPVAAPAPAAPKVPLTSSAVSASPGLSTIKLKPVIRKPTIHKPVVGARPAPIAPTVAPATAKKATQNLKSVTGPIPAQATLKKTGIIAEGIITPQQQQAAKSKTSRISLESAIGVAPAKEGPAPLKTIRLRRPTDLKPTPMTLTPKAEETPAEAPTMPTAAPEPAADEASVTQKRTLKLPRSGGIGIKPPTLGLGSPAGADVSDMGGDVPDLGAVPAFDAAAPRAEGLGVPKWVAALSLVASLAALLVMGCLLFNLVEEARHATGAGANEMAFLEF